jgi:hypothetical protein
MKNALYFLPYGIKKKHFERGLENIQRSIDNGDDVSVLLCDNSLLSCLWNPDNSYIKCLSCIDRRNVGLDMIEGKINKISFPSLNKNDLRKINHYLSKNVEDIDELKKEVFEDFDIGYGVASLIITQTLNPAPELAKYRDQINKLFWSAAKTYLCLKKILMKGEFQHVFIHNGRDAISRAVIRACESIKINYTTYEAGYDRYTYHLYENAMPQEADNRFMQIKQHWVSEKDFDKKKSIADNYFLSQRNGKKAISEQYNYVKLQNKEKLPEDWNSKKINIAIYNTSENEFAAIDDSYNLKFYKSQLDGIKKIIQSIKIKKDTHHIYLRIHPNYANNNDPSLKELLKLKSDNLTVIGPNSNVSSYKLMEESDKIVTFFSTIGCESVFWGKPTILLGNTFFKKLEGFYLPKSHEDCIKMLIEDLKPLDKIGSIMWGFYVENFGEKYKYYEPIDHVNGFFKGKILQEKYLYKSLSKNIFNYFDDLMRKLNQRKLLNEN